MTPKITVLSAYCPSQSVGRTVRLRHSGLAPDLDISLDYIPHGHACEFIAATKFQSMPHPGFVPTAQ